MKVDGLETDSKLLTDNLSAGENLVEFSRNEEIDEIIVGIKKTSKIGKFITGMETGDPQRSGI